jgi:hypothetical protein
VLRLGGNGSWSVGVLGALTSALESLPCVLEELDMGGSELGADEGRALGEAAAAGKLRTLTLGSWAMPVGALRSGEATEVSAGGKELGDAEGAVLGLLLKRSTSVTRLDLSGCSCSAECLRLVAEGLAASSCPLSELLASRLRHGEGEASAASRVEGLLEAACAHASLVVVDVGLQ